MSSDGPLLSSMAAAKAMLRDCYWWRRLADANNAWSEAEAAAHIHYDALPPPSPGPDHSLSELQAARPFALLWSDAAAGMRLRNSTAGYCCYLPSGVIVIQIEMAVPANIAANPTAVAEDVSRKLGRIMTTGNAEQPGLMELSGLAGYLPINELQLYGYLRTDAKAARDLGDCVVAELQLNWGLE